MLIISRASSNVIDLTLTENVTLASPYFLFVFTNKLSSEVSKCLLTDISTDTGRYNRFTFIEPTDLILIPGDYLYEVYENATSSLVIPGDAYLLETGILRVAIAPLTETVYSSDIATAPKVYESTD